MTQKTIETLPEDILNVLRDGIDPSSVSPDSWARLGVSLSDLVRQSLTREPPKEKGTLRMSSIGQPCNRRLWYQVNTPNDGERLEGSTRLKFLYGHILEELLLFFAELAGHKVEGRQDTLVIAGIEGHRDAIIDGTTVDAKSASTYSFKKFKEHGLAKDDPFGYLDQIEGYRKAGEDDPLVTDKDRAAFLVVDKTLGNICIDIHDRQSFPIEKAFEYKKEVVSRDEPPARGFEDIPDGKSGNRKLGVNCGYCDFRHKCWPDLRVFNYAGKPVHLTVVKREPNVPELRREEIEITLGSD